MTKRKPKLTVAEKAEKNLRKAEYMTVVLGGKQKRVKRPPLIDGVPVHEFIQTNADPVWLHQNEMWEYLPFGEDVREDEGTGGSADDRQGRFDQESNSAILLGFRLRPPDGGLRPNRPDTGGAGDEKWLGSKRVDLGTKWSGPVRKP